METVGAGSASRVSLGELVRRWRTDFGASTQDIADASWTQLGIPLTDDQLSKIELSRRRPSVWHLDALIVVLGLTNEDAESLIRAWNPSLAYADWPALIKSTNPPVSSTRRLCTGQMGSIRLRSWKEVEVKSYVKLRLTAEEDTLLRTSAAHLGSTASEVVRVLILDAIQHRRRAYSVPEVATANPSRTVERNVRMQLTADAIQRWRGIGHGLPFNLWARYIVLDGLTTGRINLLIKQPAAAVAAGGA